MKEKHCGRETGAYTQKSVVIGTELGREERQGGIREERINQE